MRRKPRDTIPIPRIDSRWARFRAAECEGVELDDPEALVLRRAFCRAHGASGAPIFFINPRAAIRVDSSSSRARAK